MSLAVCLLFYVLCEDHCWLSYMCRPVYANACISLCVRIVCVCVCVYVCRGAGGRAVPFDIVQHVCLPSLSPRACLVQKTS